MLMRKADWKEGNEETSGKEMEAVTITHLF